jgi:hypothetical protein
MPAKARKSEPQPQQAVVAAPALRLSEGVREELARVGHSTDPGTGRHLASTGSPADPARVVDPGDCPICHHA